jgi:AcrR family transcriptional regulator
MVEAAYRQFVEHGFGVPLTIIAKDAGVAVQTLYFTFHTKTELLRATLELAVLGDDQQLAPHQRSWMEELQAEPDQRKALKLLVSGTHPMFERVAPLVGIFRSGDPDVAALWEHAQQLRLDGYRQHVIPALAKKGRLRRGLDLGAATDVLFVLLSPLVYNEFVLGRRWSTARWQAWIAETLAEALFAPAVRSPIREARS